MEQWSNILNKLYKINSWKSLVVFVHASTLVHIYIHGLERKSWQQFHSLQAVCYTM